MKPKILLKQSCPHCLKFAIFAVESNIKDTLDLSWANDGDKQLDDWRAAMEASGLKPSFPALAQEDGSFVTGSDELISLFAGRNNVDVSSLFLLDYYKGGVYPAMGKMFAELKALR